MKSHLILLSVLILTILTMSQSAFSLVPDGKIKHEFKKQWHQMFIENDPVSMDIIVKNQLNVTKYYVVDLTFQSVSNPELSNKIIIPFELSPFQEESYPYWTNLTPGQWTISLNLHVNSTECCFVEGYKTWIVVQPVQDYYNLLTAMGTVLGSLAAITAVVFQALNNRRNLSESRKEREQTLNEMSQQREISRKALDLTHKEFESKMRPWLKIEMIKEDYVILGDSRYVEWGEYWNNPSKYTEPITHRIFKTRVVNIGTLPALEIKGKFVQGFTKFDRDELTKSSTTTGNMIPLMPNEDLPKSFVIKETDYQESGVMPYFLGLLIEYKINDTTNGKSGKIWKVEGTRLSLYDVWI